MVGYISILLKIYYLISPSFTDSLAVHLVPKPASLAVGFVARYVFGHQPLVCVLRPKRCQFAPFWKDWFFVFEAVISAKRHFSINLTPQAGSSVGSEAFGAAMGGGSCCSGVVDQRWSQ